jgi:hypothetical protein
MRATRWALASSIVILPAQSMPQIQTEGVTRKMVRAGSKTVLGAGSCQQLPSAGKHVGAQGVLERLAANAGV